MGRKVYITSEMSVDERLIVVAEKDPQAALLWPWLLTVFDDWGRAEANSRRLKAQVFPVNDMVTPELIDKALRLYHEAGLLILYEVQGKAYMAIPQEKWFKYQTHIRKEKRLKDESRYPAPPEINNEGSAQMRDDARNDAQGSEDERICTPSPSPSPSLSPSPSPSLSRDLETTRDDSEGKKVSRGGGVGEASAAKPPAATLESLYSRYSPDQQKIIDDYWEIIRFTRKSAKLAESVKITEMEYWSRYPPDIVIQALNIHRQRYQTKDERYTRGIIRRLHREIERGVNNGQFGTSRASPGNAVGTQDYDEFVLR